MPRRHVLFSADDFGMSVEINQAIEQAHLHGVLSTASLMVAGPAAADAVARAKRLPTLNVGLHLVVIEGESVLSLPPLTDKQGWFGNNGVKLGFRYFFNPAARKALFQEIEAQFQAFRKTGLTLDHANAHKHMHLHPLVGKYLIKIGRNYGLKAVRVPCEPQAPLGENRTLGAECLRLWTKILRFQLKKAGMKTSDYCFGISWSGQFTTDRLKFLLPRLPAGSSEIYFHPATGQNARMKHLMPAYHPQEELKALLDKEVHNSLNRHCISSIIWQDCF